MLASCWYMAVVLGTAMWIFCPTIALKFVLDIQYWQWITLLGQGGVPQRERLGIGVYPKGLDMDRGFFLKPTSILFYSYMFLE